jgi:hypothetical protein
MEYGKQPECKACGKSLPIVGSHQCEPTYKELEVEMKQAKKCNNCMTREIFTLTNEPLSCNGTEDGTCDQDWRDKGRIEQLEAHIKLHAGDCFSLSNESDMFRERCEEADADITQLTVYLDEERGKVRELEAELDKHKWVSVEDEPSQGKCLDGMYPIIVNGGLRLGMYSSISKRWLWRGMVVYPTFYSAIITLPKTKELEQDG